MRRENISKWEVTRKKGKLKFILQVGIEGLPLFGILTFVESRREGVELTMGRIGLAATIWTIVWILFGYIIWVLSERWYHEFKATEEE